MILGWLRWYRQRHNWEKWRKVKEKVEMMRRTSEEEEKGADMDGNEGFVIATVRVHVVISDRAVREIGQYAFGGCVNLWKITAPFVEGVGEQAFRDCGNLVEVVLPEVDRVDNEAFLGCSSLRKVALGMVDMIGQWAFVACHDLRHITLPPDFEVDFEVDPHHLFNYCFSLEVLAASTNFEVDTGDKDNWGDNNPTRGIIRYLKWRSESDAAHRERKEQMYTYMTMIKLCETDEKDPLAPPARAKPNDPISKFLVEKCMGDTGIGRHILSFFGETRGKGDLRGATKAELLAVGLELKVLREENNLHNEVHWGVEVDDNGLVES